jgi:hypothetical protein
MKYIALLKFVTLILITLLLSNTLYSQEYIKEVQSVNIPLNPQVQDDYQVILPVPQWLNSIDSDIHSAFAVVNLSIIDSSTDFTLSETSFECKLEFSLLLLDSENNELDVLQSNQYELSISNQNPISELRMNLGAFEPDILQQISSIKVVSPDFSYDEESVLQKLTSKASIEVEYKCGVTLSNIPSQFITTKGVSIAQSTGIFSWDCNTPLPYTMYQLQLLKLFNKDPNFTEEHEIKADINWQKAITIDVIPSAIKDINGNIVLNHSYNLTIGQGTGFYVWRVRPIGTLYKGGVSNAMNFGDWSGSFPSSIELNKDNLPSKDYFYFTDSDENTNKIFSRVFTEGNRVKEISTYANNLNQVNQVKTYIPSDNVTIISQTIADYSGREALRTLPMPVVGKIDGYVENFARTDNHQLYMANHFDHSDNAEPMYETDHMDYYNENDNKRIPNSEGYPFSQTTFYNDPLNRVKEQGTPGLTHQITNDGNGKTTKYYYGTASKTELVRLFGSEAPNHETVSKTVQIDPNNVATVTYTTADNNVLATTMSFTDNENTVLGKISPKTTNKLEVNDEITVNTMHKWGFQSSKRIVLMQETDMKIEYSIKKHVLDDLCVDIEVDCNYTLDISIRSLDNDQVYTIVPNQSLKSISKQINVDGEIFYRVVPNNEYKESITLPFGTYIVEKRLYFGNPESNSTNLANQVLDQIAPIKEEILQQLETIDNQEQMEGFQSWLKDYSVNHNIDDATIELFKFTEEGELEPIDLEDSNEIIDYVIINTACCKLPFSVKWSRTFSFNQEPSITIENDIPTFVPDFEAYANSYLNHCQTLNNDQFYKYMDGWYGNDIPKGTFNLMVYHMLTDNMKEHVTNPFLEESKESGEAIGTPTENQDNLPFWHNEVYSTKQLFTCWENQLIKLHEQFCQPIDWSDADSLSNVNLNDAIEAESGVSGLSSKQLKKIVKEVPFWKRRRTKKKIKRKINKLLANTQLSIDTSNDDEPIQVNIVRDFLNCTGYSFVKILTPYNPLPLPEDARPENDQIKYNQDNPDAASNFKYILPNGVTTNEYFSGASFRKDSPYDYYYYPLSDWEPMLNDEPLFPKIRNPIYAFKYFEYHMEGHPETQELELSTCYSDPNDCYKVVNFQVEQNNNGGFALIPCCASFNNGTYDYSQCFEDFDYPNLAELIEVAEPNDPRFVIEGSNSAKRIVDEFDNGSRLKCPYTNNFWSSGQRYTFWELIKSIQFEDEADPDDDETEFFNECGSYTSQTQWYWHPDEYIVSHDECLDEFENSENPEQCNLEPINIEGNNEFNWVQIGMYNLKTSCLEACSLRRNEVRIMLEELLIDYCYEIDGCIAEGDEYQNVILSSEIDGLVDELMERCELQCNIDTYGCYSRNARMVETQKTDLGNNIYYPKLLLGIAGYPEDGEFNGIYHDNNHSWWEDATFSPIGQSANAKKYTVTDTQPESSYSWYQYTMLKQATEWELELSIPSKCDQYTLYTLHASNFANVLVTTQGVENFGYNSLIEFADVDFGTGTESMSISYSTSSSSADIGKTLTVSLKNGSTTQNLGSFTIENTNGRFTEVELNLNPAIVGEQGIAGVWTLSIKGWPQESDSNTRIAWVKLKAQPGTYSNIQEFVGNGSTFMHRSQYEINTTEIPDFNLPATNQPVSSPASTIEREFGN